jgi:hypothetical protein
MKVAATCDESGLPPFSALALIVRKSKLDDGRDVPGYHPSVSVVKQKWLPSAYR